MSEKERIPDELDFRVFPVETGTDVRILDIDGCPRVVVVIDNHTKHQALRDIIPLVLDLHRTVADVYGPCSNDAQDHFLGELERRHTDGVDSYGDLAGKVNDLVIGYLKEYQEYKIQKSLDRETAKKTGKPVRYGTDLSLLQKGFRWQQAVQLLSVFGSEVDEIEEILDGGYSNLQEGYPVFPPQFPIDSSIVRTKLRGWRRRNG